VDKEYFEGTLRDLTWISLHPTNPSAAAADSENAPHPDLIVWPGISGALLYQRSSIS